MTSGENGPFRLLVTGLSGFVGQNLLTRLPGDRFNIQGISREALTALESLGDVDAVIHLAGKAHDLAGNAGEDEYYRVNSDLTRRVYDAFLRSGARTFIFMSSVKAASDDPDGILTETVIPAPATPYGRSKLRAEAYIQSVPLPEGKSYYILRPCMIHGPGNKGNLNLLYKFVRKGIPYPLSAFDNRRSFLSVENLCFVIGALVSETGIPSGIYNVSDDEPLSTNEIVRTISASLGKKARLLPVSRQLIGFMARVGDGLHLPFTTNRLNKLVSDYVVSNSKLKMALNAELPLSSREGLLITLKSFQGNG